MPRQVCDSFSYLGHLLLWPIYEVSYIRRQVSSLSERKAFEKKTATSWRFLPVFLLVFTLLSDFIYSQLIFELLPMRAWFCTSLFLLITSYHRNFSLAYRVMLFLYKPSFILLEIPIWIKHIKMISSAGALSVFIKPISFGIRHNKNAVTTAFFKWTWRELYPRPKAPPSKHLPSQSLYWHSLCRPPNDRLPVLVAS